MAVTSWTSLVVGSGLTSPMVHLGWIGEPELNKVLRATASPEAKNRRLDEPLGHFLLYGAEPECLCPHPSPFDSRSPTRLPAVSIPPATSPIFTRSRNERQKTT